MNYTKFYNRPPTLRMVHKLKECLEKEKNNEKIPCLAEEMKSSLAGLYKRGLVETRMEYIHQKRIMCIHISALGRQYLDALKA